MHHFGFFGGFSFYHSTEVVGQFTVQPAAYFSYNESLCSASFHCLSK